MKISEAFNLGQTQAGLDFVDVDLDRDAPLFIDPFAISQRLDSLSQESHLTLQAFFQQIVDSIRAEQPADAQALLLQLREPNETRLGYSTTRPQGAGIGMMQAGQLFAALKSSTAVRTGFLKSLEECELMIDGVARDKLSDLTTNVIRWQLVGAYIPAKSQTSVRSLPSKITFTGYSSVSIAYSSVKSSS